MKKVKLAVVGVGNCASSLIQGIEYYRHHHNEHSLYYFNYTGSYNERRSLSKIMEFEKQNWCLNINYKISKITI